MGLIGIIIASVVSIFWHPTWLTVAINYLGVFIFIGLTAYDTQRLKAIASRRPMTEPLPPGWRSTAR